MWIDVLVVWCQSSAWAGEGEGLGIDWGVGESSSSLISIINMG